MSIENLIQPENLHANTAEEHSGLIVPEDTIFPPSNEQLEEIEVAGLADKLKQGAEIISIRA